MIDYDSEVPRPRAPTRDQLAAAGGAGPPSLESFISLDWPEALRPLPAETVPDDPSLPAAEVLIITWTTDEGHALSRVLTPGHDSHRPTVGSPGKPGMSYWAPYTKPSWL